MHMAASSVGVGLLLAAVGASPLSTLLEVKFPTNEAGSPSITLGGKLWAHGAPILLSHGCPVHPADDDTHTAASNAGKGADQWGSYTYIKTQYSGGCAGHAAVEVAVRLYDHLPAAVFSTRFPAGLAGTRLANETKNASLAPIAAFPSIPFSSPMTAFDSFAWPAGQLGFRASNGPLTPADFKGQTGNVPSPLFFVDRQTNATLVVSPMNHFHGWACTAVDNMSPGSESIPSPSGWGCGIMNTVPELPAGFESGTVLFGGVGVTDTMAKWGSAMQAWYNTTREKDLQTTKLGVYTDNGAVYNNPSNLNGSTAPEVFGEMFDDFRRDGVPADNYLMLDDWWYSGVHPGSMLIDTPVANPEWFPHGLDELWERIGKVALDVYSVHYTKNFTLFQQLGIPTIHDDWAPPGGYLPGPTAHTSQQFYEALFATWGADKGMLRMHEIDFLVFLAYQTPAFQADPEGARWFLQGMNAAAVAKNVTIQYCSASAIDAMQSLRFNAVTNIRASTDYACFVNYQVGPGYLISWALGLRPSKDVLWTTEVQPTKTKPPGAGCGGNIKGCSSCGGNFTWAQHYTAELDMILALFSTGPVGIGDGLGHTNATRAKATCTADGTLLQPDKPLTPLDWSIFPDGEQRIAFANCAVQGPHNEWPCRPQLLQTHTAVSGLQWHHIVAVAVDAYALSLADLWPTPSPQQPGWHYAVVRRSVLEHGCVEGAAAFGPGGCATSTVCPGGDTNSTCLPVIDTKVGFWDVANLHIAWAQYLLAPCSPEGWCLLGEMGKYNPASKQRLQTVAFGPDGVTATVAGVKDETVELFAITPHHRIAVAKVIIGADGHAQATFKFRKVMYRIPQDNRPSR